MQPIVSVILTTYNRADLVGKAIESVLTQTFSDWELIINNDGSTDAGATASALAPYAEHPRVRIITHENLGRAQTLNVGIAAAQGEFIALQDDDDISAPRRLQECVATLRAHPEWDAVTTNARFFDSMGEPVRGRKRDVVHRFYRRALWEKIGGYHALFRATEDDDFWLRAREHGATSGHIAQPLHHIRSPKEEHIGGVRLSHLSLSPEASLYALVAEASAAMRQAGLSDLGGDAPDLGGALAVLSAPAGGLEPAFWQAQILPLWCRHTSREIRFRTLGRRSGKARDAVAQLQSVMTKWQTPQARQRRIRRQMRRIHAFARARRFFQQTWHAVWRR